MRIAFSAHANRADNVSVTVRHASGEKTIRVNQRRRPADNGLFLSLGEFDFDGAKLAAVTISNRDADGYVAVDAVQWVRRSTESHSQ